MPPNRDLAIPEIDDKLNALIAIVDQSIRHDPHVVFFRREG
jgi:hypothetical protein